MTKAKSHHLYMDEAAVRWPDTDDRVLLEGGLLCKGPLRPHDAEWYRDLLAKPHCSERALDKETGVKGAAVIEGLARGGLEHGRMVCVGARYRHNEGLPFNHIKESLVLGLLIRVIQEGNFTRDDKLVLHPERWDESGGMITQGRFEGILGAMRWLPLPPERVPCLEVKVYPGEPHIPLGQGVVDHVLWNLRSAAKKGNPAGWRKTINKTVNRLHLQRFCSFEALPTLTRPGALVSTSRILLGAQDAIDWHDLCHEPSEVLHELLVLAHERLDGPSWNTLVERAMDDLEAWVDQPRRAKEAGVKPTKLFELMEQLSQTVGRSPARADMSAKVRGRLAYALARCRTHAGKPSSAWEAWDVWQGLRSPGMTEPEDLQRELIARRSLAVVRSDLFLFDQAADSVRDGLELLDQHLASFPHSFDRAITLGTLGQNLVLAGRPDEAIAPLQLQRTILRDANPSPDPEHLSFPWTWLLVACGRGAHLEDPAGLITDLIDEIAIHTKRDLRANLANNRYLLWGLTEALNRAGPDADITDDVIDAVDGALERLLAARQGGSQLPHPTPLVLRAMARRRDPDIHHQALNFSSASHKRLAKVETAALTDTRTLASWLAVTAVDDRLRRRVEQFRQAAQRALVDLEPSDPRLDGVRRHLECFADIDPDNPASAEAYLALGGY